jgi:quinol monooxygenase YgiN
MIIVTGSVRARPETFDEILAASLEHVRRSRTEPGCLMHSVHQNVEDPLTLVFVEHWSDRAALAAHFKVPESRAFVTEIATRAAAAPVMSVYEANPTEV